jgi:hypothetical protein
LIHFIGAEDGGQMLQLREIELRGEHGRLSLSHKKRRCGFPQRRFY